MKTLITITLLVLVVMACNEKKQTANTNSSELSLANGAVTQKAKVEIEINSQLPTSYDFEYKLTVVTEANDKKIEINYLVKPGATYYGTTRLLSKKDLSKKTITVMDVGRNKMLTFRDGKGGKFLRVRDTPKLKDADIQNITIERIDTKKILGYDCQGYKVSTNDGISTIYLTQDAGFGFIKGFGAYSKLSMNGKGIDAAIVEELESGLLLELEYNSNGNNTAVYSSKMIVKEITKQSFTLDLSEYKSIGSYTN